MNHQGSIVYVSDRLGRSNIQHFLEAVMHQKLLNFLCLGVV